MPAMRAASAAFAAALLWATCGQAQVAEKTAVDVAFSVTDPHYTNEFTDPDLAILQAHAAAVVATVFDRRFPFLEFRADEPSDYTLTVRLARAEGDGSSASTEFGFHFALSGPDVPEGSQSYLKFRDKSRYLDPIGSVDALAAEIEGSLTQLNGAKIISDLLSHVPIAEDGAFQGGDLSVWIINRDRVRLCMTADSHLDVMTAFPVAQVGRVHARFATQVMAVDPGGATGTNIVAKAASTADPDMIRELRAATPVDVKVERVFVIEHVPNCPQQPQDAPADSFLTAQSNP